MNSRPTTTQVIQRYPEAFDVILAKSGLIGWVHPPPGMQRSPTSLTTYFFRFRDLKKEKTSFIIVHQPRFPRNKGSHFPYKATIWNEKLLFSLAIFFDQILFVFIVSKAVIFWIQSFSVTRQQGTLRGWEHLLIIPRNVSGL